MSFLVIGAGSWGTAIAIHLARLHPDVYLWDRSPARIALMQKSRENTRYLPGIPFPERLKLTDHFVEANTIVIAVPSHAFRTVLHQLKSHQLFRQDPKLIWITKGLDSQHQAFLDHVSAEILGEKVACAVLSGPTFAKEVAAGLPTAVTLAANHHEWGKELVKAFHSPHFRVYFSEDMVGVQLGGAVKNVLAVAVGLAEGLQCGANAQAALITRGLAEMRRLGAACGALPETLMGLSGVGDLILTCTSNQSRNRRFGIQLGQGITPDMAERTIGQVVEGIQTTREVFFLSQRYGVDMPITHQVYQVLYEGVSPQQALKNLLMREPREENH